MKARRFLIAIIITVAISIVVYLSTILYGTPWGKVDAKKQAEYYLKNKYTQKMIIDGVYYSPDASSYYVEAHPQQNSKLGFNVRKMSVSGILVDNYFLAVWENEVESAINPVVQKIFSKQDSVVFPINANPVYDEYKSNITQIPTFKAVRNKIKDHLWLSFHIERKFNEENPDQEYRKIFQAIQYVKSTGYRPDEIDFYYKDTAYEMKNNDLVNITSKNDIKKFHVD